MRQTSKAGCPSNIQVPHATLPKETLWPFISIPTWKTLSLSPFYLPLYFVHFSSEVHCPARLAEKLSLLCSGASVEELAISQFQEGY